MKCPVCTSVDLLMSERQGVEIDYCPKCRGIWLDRGELDKLIEKAIMNEASNVPPQNNYNSPPRYDNHEYREHHKYKKKHWLNDLFD